MSKLDHAGFMLRNLKSVMTLLQIYHIACNVRSERAARYRNCLTMNFFVRRYLRLFAATAALPGRVGARRVEQQGRTAVAAQVAYHHSA